MGKGGIKPMDERSFYQELKYPINSLFKEADANAFPTKRIVIFN